MAKVTKKQAENTLKEDAKKITDEDIQKVLKKEEEIEDMFKSSGPLGRFIEDVKILFSIIKDYKNGNYRNVPWWSIAAIAAALLYVLNPIDLIPDVIPFIGQVDDALVVAACLKLVETDLHEYKDWKIKNA